VCPRVTRDKIDEKLQLLHQIPSIPASPTAETVFSLPVEMQEQILATNYSQDIIQKLSDLMGYYLGLLESVRIRIGVESSENMLANPRTMDEAGKVGIYSVTGRGAQKEIRITKKYRLKLKHVLAILAHESVHNYLDSMGIEDKNTDEDEILTDIAAVYLGLGRLLLQGYEPIKWESDHWSRGSEHGYIAHSITIGYVPYQQIRYAIHRAAILREEKEFVRLLPLWSQIRLRYCFWRKDRKRRKLGMQIEDMVALLENAQDSFNAIAAIVQSTPATGWRTDIPAKSAKALVELLGTVTTGKFQGNLDNAIHGIQCIEKSGNEQDIAAFHGKCRALYRQVRIWQEVVQSCLISS